MEKLYKSKKHRTDNIICPKERKKEKNKGVLIKSERLKTLKTNYNLAIKSKGENRQEYYYHYTANTTTNATISVTTNPTTSIKTNTTTSPTTNTTTSPANTQTTTTTTINTDIPNTKPGYQSSQPSYRR